MSTIQLFVGVAAACIALPCWGQQTEAATANGLLAQAIQHNRELMAVKQRADEARGLLQQAGVRPAMTFEATGATGRPLGTKGEEQYGAGLSRTIETAGKRSLRIRAAEKQLALAEAEYGERVRQLRFEIRSRFAEMTGEAARLRTLDSLADTYRQSLDLMKVRVQQGDAAALERDLLAVELNRTSALRETVAGRLEVARADLARLTGLADPASVPVPAQEAVPRTEFDLPELQRTALAGRADLRAAVALQEQGEAETELAKALGRADLTLSAGYTRVYSRFDDQFGLTPSGGLTQLRDRDDVLSVGVSVPLFGRNRNAGNVEASVARSRASRYRREFLERSIPIEVEGAWRRLSGSRSSFRLLDETVLKQSEKNLEIIRRAYQLGQLRLLDVLNEQRRLLDTQLAGIDARLDVMRALAELERATGGELQ